MLEPLPARTCVVLDDEDVPLAGAPVIVSLDARNDWEAAPRFLEYRAETDASGAFDVARFPRSASRDGSSGGVIVRVEHPDFARLHFKRLDGLPRDEAGRTILRLERGRTVWIEFRDEGTGEAVSDVAFRLVSVFGTWSAKGRANEAGLAELTQVASSPVFELVLLAKGWTHDGEKRELRSSRRIVRVPGGDGVVLTVGLRPAPVVSGRLVDADDGRPLAGIRVRAELADHYDPELSRIRSTSCLTGVDGEFTLAGLSTERLVFSLESRDRVLLGVVPEEGGAPERTLRLRPDEPRSIRLLATRAASIRGQVRDGEGRPLPGASVRLVPSGGDEDPAPPAPIASATTDAEGRYLLEGLATGPAFILIAEHPTHAGVGRLVDLAPGDAPRGEDFRLTGGAHLEVRVVGADSLPLENVRVEVASGLVAEGLASRIGAASIRSALSSGDGVAGFDRLATGPTELVLRDDGADGERFPEERRRLELLEGPQSLLIRVESRHFVRGVARRRDGTPIANARLVFGPSPETARLDEILVTTDAAGNFAFEARKPASSIREVRSGGTLERRLGDPAREGELGWSYVLLRAEVWELKQPSRLTDADTTPLLAVESPRIHPRRDRWVLVFE
ncbi:MAG: carboxypeptidase-like regulatory domain-containing protein [Planctomycetota bacterium]